MTLQELLASRDDWADEDTIYVIQPWSADAEAVISNESLATTGPIIQSGERFDYFLEGLIARDFLEDLGASSAEVSREACDRLIRYAVDDA